MKSHRPRWILLPIAAVVIAGLCAWRMTRPPRPVVSVQQGRRVMPPRGWELVDQHKHVVKFDRYLGRQPVILWFLGEVSPAEDPVMDWLRRHADLLGRAGWEIVVVGMTRPVDLQRLEQSSGQGWPFPVLSDLYERDPTPAPVHRLWGAVDSGGSPSAALFLIDRTGYVPAGSNGPRPEESPLQSLNSLLGR